MRQVTELPKVTTTEYRLGVIMNHTKELIGLEEEAINKDVVKEYLPFAWDDVCVMI